jgi:hypothetical protein
MSEWSVKKLEAVDVEGSGWEIKATIENGKNPSILLSSAVVNTVGYAPWLDPFTAKDVEDMIGRTFNEMVDAWNEKNA